jgi:ornithine carbamoyltransferase
MLQGRHLLSIEDITKDELGAILALSTKLKKLQKGNSPHQLLKGKTLAMIFQKPSNRTRMSFEVGISHLGGHAVNVRPNEIQMGDREPIADIARTISRYVDGVIFRGKHEDLVEFAEYSDVPVINGLSDLFHPCQAIADALTIEEHKGSLKNLKVCWVGDGNNVCNSLIQICDLLGIEITVACPAGHEPMCLKGSARGRHIVEPEIAVRGADVVYTDVWTSMGQEEEYQQRLDIFKNYTVTTELMNQAAKGAVFMHCLPAHRGEEVDHDVFESPASVVFDQAENRMHAQKAILALLIEGAVVY